MTTINTTIAGPDVRSLFAAPPRSLEQRMTALAEANRIRTARARLKDEMKAGRRTASQVLADPPDYVATMRVSDLLMAIPRWGLVKVQHAFRHTEISPSKTIGGLTPRQRRELLGRLHGR
jgi:S13-like H2TH domain